MSSINKYSGSAVGYGKGCVSTDRKSLRDIPMTSSTHGQIQVFWKSCKNEIRVIRKATSNRKTAHFQWLSEDIGDPALAQHLYAVIGLMLASDGWDGFKHALDRAFPKRGTTLEWPLIPNPLGVQRAAADFVAIALRLAGVNAFARALPPLIPPRWPSSTAAGFLRHPGLDL